jgi:predicted PurR-regulated permease PerM
VSHDVWAWAERLSIVGLFCLALGYTAYLTQSVLVPIVLAWVAGTILAPLVDELVRRGLPRPVAVVLVTIVALLIILSIVGLLSTPLTYWVGKTAELGALIKQKLQLLSQPMAFFDEIAKALAEFSGPIAPHRNRLVLDHQRYTVRADTYRNRVSPLLFCDDFLPPLSA